MSRNESTRHSLASLKNWSKSKLWSSGFFWYAAVIWPRKTLRMMQPVQVGRGQLRVQHDKRQED